MKVVLIWLLLGFGSLSVDIDHVNVWVPAVAIQGVSAVTVAGVLTGPG
jgi:hypothetical protein